MDVAEAIEAFRRMVSEEYMKPEYAIGQAQEAQDVVVARLITRITSLERELQRFKEVYGMTVRQQG